MMKTNRNTLFKRLMKNADWNKLKKKLKKLQALTATDRGLTAAERHSCSVALVGPYRLLCRDLYHNIRRYIQYGSCRECWFEDYCKGRAKLLPICAAQFRPDHHSVFFAIMKNGEVLTPHQIAKR